MHFRTSPWGIITCLVFLTLLFPACTRDVSFLDNTVQAQDVPVYDSYQDIPGVTQAEIAAIEAFRSQNRSFVYGMTLSAECFEDRDGMGGYAVLFCDWLSNLFDIEFTPTVYGWTDLLNGFESGNVDFTGEFSATAERLKNYTMTSAIAERMVTITHLTGSPDPTAISTSRRPRIGFLSGSTTHSLFLSMVRYEFDATFVDSATTAYEMIRSGILDGFIDETQEGEAEIYQDLTVSQALPLMYSPVSLAARKVELTPIISVVQKYLDIGALYHLVGLYNQGYKDYLTYRFHESLTAEEMAYVAAHDGSSGTLKPIPLSMEVANYPVAFYNRNEKAWQGIAWDVLKEIESVSDLRFEVVNNTDASWNENLSLLESGQASIVSKLIHIQGREGRFLWSTVPYARDNFALLSKTELPDLGINEILYSKIGMAENTSYAELFHQWFPNHPKAKEYPNTTAAMAALERGEIDLFMGTKNGLLTLTNYMEEPGFKVNLNFYRSANSYFGFNVNEELLCSIINKAQALIDTGLIENRWLTRVFDYRRKLVRLRQPYLISFSIVLALVVFLLMALLRKYKESGAKLELMVNHRTYELEERSKELEVQKDAAQTAYKVKNRFLANMSHEIRTPLNAIIGLSQAELEKVPPDSKENLTTIHHSGAALLTVINDLLDISNIESGQMKLKTEEYSLAAFINSIATAAKLRIGSKEIEFLLELDENLPARLCGDTQRLKQILNNLVSNAVKFTRTGSITFRAGSLPNNTLAFEVQDTGIGIKDEDLDQLFSGYGQVDTQSSRSAYGAGMGLIISKKLVELLGGDLTVVSELGKGSTFTATIPQTPVQAETLGKDTVDQLKAFSWHELLEEKPYLPYARVLIVDDVPTNHAVARGIMKPYKMTIDCASSGLEAVDAISKMEVVYDAIFMDHMMPGMDGMEATKLIRSLGTDYASSIPIIALTANALPENEEIFLSNGFNAFMAKPINVNMLNKVLLTWVRDEEKEKLLLEEPREEEKESHASHLQRYSIEGVDLAAGAAQFGGEETYLEIVKVFVHDTPKLLKDIRKSLDKFRIMPAAAAAALEAIKNYTITVHGIKGSCYGICATPIGDLAKELEMAAKAQDLGKVMELNGRFIQATEKLVNELKVIVPQKEEKPRLEKDKPDNNLLEKLLSAARAYNINGMLEALDELDLFIYKQGDELVNKLRDAAEEYEYTEVTSQILAYLADEQNASGTLSESAS